MSAFVRPQCRRRSAWGRPARAVSSWGLEEPDPDESLLPGPLRWGTDPTGDARYLARVAAFVLRRDMRERAQEEFELEAGP